MLCREKVNVTHKKGHSPSVSNQSKQIPGRGDSHLVAVIQRAMISPHSLTHANVLLLQRTIGNHAVVRMMRENVCGCADCRLLSVNHIPSIEGNGMIQLKNDMRCRASITVKGKKFEANGENDQAGAESNESTIGTWGVLANKFEKVKSKTGQSVYGCAEPTSLANAVAKMDSKDKISKVKDIKIHISDAILLKDFVNQGLFIGNVKPRCDNCQQWIPGNEVKL